MQFINSANARDNPLVTAPHDGQRSLTHNRNVMREEYGSMTDGGHKSRFIVLLASFHSYHFVFTCLYLHFLRILHIATFHHIQRSVLFQYCSTADKAK